MSSGFPVCVVVTYNPTGDFKPICFGAEIDGMRYRYNIKSASIVKNSSGEIVFNCEYVDMGRLKTVRLGFDVIGCRWTIG
jgi:hypothetical protein